MPLTLWRGHVLLGTLQIRDTRPWSPPRGGCFVSALLLQNEQAGASLTSLIQTRVDLFPGRPVMQHATKPLVAGERHPSTPGIAVGVWPARPASADGAGAPSVAPERQLSVRDDEGRVISASYITLREFRPLPGTEAEVMLGYPAEALRDGRVWLVSAGLEVDEPVA
jgi:hypothetical protein